MKWVPQVLLTGTPQMFAAACPGLGLRRALGTQEFSHGDVNKVVGEKGPDSVTGIRVSVLVSRFVSLTGSQQDSQRRRCFELGCEG